MIQLFGKLISKDPNFYRTVAGIAIPIGLQGLITTGINMMDTIMIGTLGETELSAVSLANQFINIYQILCMGRRARPKGSTISNRPCAWIWSF